MSLNAHRFQKHHGHLCACGKPAIFVSPSSGRVRGMADHPLCSRCFRAERQRANAKRLADHCTHGH